MDKAATTWVLTATWLIASIAALSSDTGVTAIKALVVALGVTFVSSSVQRTRQ